MEVSADGGEQTVLLPPGDGAVSAAYSPHGREIAAWTKKGLEILDLANGDRNLVFRPSSVGDGYIFRSWGIGGLAWSKVGNEIAFSLLNRKTGQSELWVVSEDGRNARSIYSTKEGQVVVSAFLE
jgi:Tol biopolymer transport system component